MKSLMNQIKYQINIGQAINIKIKEAVFDMASLISKYKIKLFINIILPTKSQLAPFIIRIKNNNKYQNAQYTK